jgi:hypothetical protein
MALHRSRLTPEAACPMGFVRFGTGRDAADVALATIFGNVKSHRPTVRAQAAEDAAQVWVRPHHCAAALSPESGPAPPPGV